jgi:hypothetical protein
MDLIYAIVLIIVLIILIFVVFKLFDLMMIVPLAYAVDENTSTPYADTGGPPKLVPTLTPCPLLTT